MRSAALGLAALFSLAPVALAQSKGYDDVVKTHYEKVDDVAGVGLLFTKTGQYQVSPKWLAHLKRQEQSKGIKKGAKVRVYTLRGKFVRLTLGWGERMALLVATAKSLEQGDEIRINGEPRVFVKATKKGVRVTSAARAKPYTVRWKALESLEKVQAAAAANANPGVEFDSLLELVHPYDTVELELTSGERAHGVLTVVNKAQLVLIGADGRERTFPRGDVKSARHEAVELQRAYPFEDGALTVRVRRFRQQKTKTLRFEVRVSHDAEGTILTRFPLTLNVSEGFNDSSAPFVPRVRPIPPLFPGQVVTYDVTTDNPLYVDGALVRPQFEALRFDAPEARSLVLAALETEGREGRLRELYHSQIQDPDVLHLLLSRTLVPPMRVGGELHARLSEELLVASGPLGARVILADLRAEDDALRLTTLAEGKLSRSPLPGRLRPKAWRQKLLQRLAAQGEDALDEGRALELFGLYRERGELSGEIQAVFAAHPSATVEQVFALGVPGAEDAETTELAAQVIHGLGRAALEPLGVKGNAKPRAAIEQAFAQAADAQRAEQQADLKERVDAARRLAKEGKLPAALETLEGVLATENPPSAARKVFAAVAVQLAQSKGDGASAQLLERAAKDSRAARSELGRLLARGLADDIDGVVVRDAPTNAALSLHAVEVGAELQGEANAGPWIQVRTRQARVGFVRRDCVTPQGDVFVVRGPAPFVSLEQELERARELNPDGAARCDALLGTLNARRYAELVAERKDDEALAYAEVAQRLAPDDPRLGSLSGLWWRANRSMILLVGVFTLLVIASLVTVGKRVKAELVAAEDLSGQDLEIILEYGVDPWVDDDDEDGVLAGAGNGNGQAYL